MNTSIYLDVNLSAAFSFRASAATWLRSAMGKFRLPVIFVILLLPSIAVSDTLTFDDLTTYTGSSITDSSAPLYYQIEDNNYGGFEWNSVFLMWQYWVNDEHPVSGYENGIVSGEYAAWKNDNASGVISRGDLFDFNSASLTAAWENSLSVTFEGYIGGLSGTLLHTQTVVIDTFSPTYFEFNFEGIDTLKFFSFNGVNAGLGGGGNQVVIDNLSVSTVPIPAAAWLFGSALLGLAGIGRNRKKAA